MATTPPPVSCGCPSPQVKTVQNLCFEPSSIVTEYIRKKDIKDLLEKKWCRSSISSHTEIYKRLLLDLEKIETTHIP
jgi:hypothetical protein